MPSIRLIVNADDLGNGPETDRGIFKAFTDGIVSSASLLVTGPSWRKAARQAQLLGLPLGIHLDLSERKTIGPAISGLTDSSGCFPGKILTRKQLINRATTVEALTAEFLAQIDLARSAGIAPDHLDTHQHCALLPVVTEALCRACAASGISRLRLPLPQEPAVNDPPELRKELSLYRTLAPAFAEATAQDRLTTPQGLFGMPLLNRLDTPQLAELLKRLPVGTWELMVHPGYCDRRHPFATTARETELAALTDPAIRALLQKRNIQLTSFAELPCAC